MSQKNENFQSEDSEYFHQLRERNNKVKKQQRDDRTKSVYATIIDFKEVGIEFFKLNDYQYRFVKEGHRIDYFPTSGKYHDITLKKRGTIPAYKIITLFKS